MKKVINNIKSVIFDMDGVIFDSERVWQKAFKLANKKMGVHVSEKFRRTCSGRPYDLNIQRLKKQIPNIDAEQFMNLANDIYDEEIENNGVIIKDGFIDLVSYLKNKNIKTALCTGSRKIKLIKLFQKANLSLDELFDVVITGDDVKYGKPEPEPYLKVCEKLGECPNQCLVLEDSINGIISAYSAGTVPVMVIDIIKPDKETKRKCLRIVKNLKSIEKLI